MERSDTYLLKPAEVALRLGVSRSWLYEAAKAGRIPCFRLGDQGGPVRFRADDLEAWLGRARYDGPRAERARETINRAPGAGSDQAVTRRSVRSRAAGDSADQLSWPQLALTDAAGP